MKTGCGSSPPFDGVVRSLLQTRGYHEKTEIDHVCTMLDDSSVVLDIGANVGFWTLPIAQKLQGGSGTVHAFEPTPDTLGKLRTSLAINDLKHVCLHGYGISDLEEVLSFAVFDAPGTSSGWNTFGKPHEGFTGAKPSMFLNARVRPLDTWWKEAGKPTCAFVKIDVEGFETRVLQGGTQFFSHHRTVEGFFIFTEINSMALMAAGTDAIRLFDSFTELGYEVFRQGLRSELTLARREHFLNRMSENVLVAPIGSDFKRRWSLVKSCAAEKPGCSEKARKNDDNAPSILTHG